MGNVNTANNASYSADVEYSSVSNAMQLGYRGWVFCETYLLLPILLVGLAGHAWTWLVYGRRWRTWKSTCKVYLLAMSVCDIVALLTYSLPEFLNNSIWFWTKASASVSIGILQQSTIACQILRYLLHVSFCGANLMVIAVSFETLLALSSPTTQLSNKRSTILASAIMCCLSFICIPLPFAYTVNPVDFAVCELDVKKPMALYITVVIVECITKVLPPILLVVCNVLLIYHAQKLRSEARDSTEIRVVPAVAAKRRATMVIETLAISVWTNVAILPLILLEAVPLLIIFNPDVSSWSLGQLYTYNTLLNWSYVALIVSQITCATNWAVYSYWVKFFWRDSWNYVRCKCDLRSIGAADHRGGDPETRQTAFSEAQRNASVGHESCVQFEA